MLGAETGKFPETLSDEKCTENRYIELIINKYYYHLVLVLYWHAKLAKKW